MLSVLAFYLKAFFYYFSTTVKFQLVFFKERYFFLQNVPRGLGLENMRDCVTWNNFYLK